MNRLAKIFFYTLPVLLVLEYTWIAWAFDLLRCLETPKIIFGNLVLIGFILANIFFFTYLIPKIQKR